MQNHFENGLPRFEVVIKKMYSQIYSKLLFLKQFLHPITEGLKFGEFVIIFSFCRSEFWKYSTIINIFKYFEHNISRSYVMEPRKEFEARKTLFYFFFNSNK